MTTITSTRSLAPTLRTQGPPPPPPGGRQGGGAVDTAAKALGMRSDDLLEQLKNGASMKDVAETRGVSLDDLTKALKAGAPKELQESGGIDSVVSSMIEQKGLPQGPPPPPQGFAAEKLDGSTTGILGGSLTSSQQTTLTELSTLLDTDSSSLLDQLKSGTSLADLLSAKKTPTTPTYDGLLIDTKA